MPQFSRFLLLVDRPALFSVKPSGGSWKNSRRISGCRFTRSSSSFPTQKWQLPSSPQAARIAARRLTETVLDTTKTNSCGWSSIGSARSFSISFLGDRGAEGLHPFALEHNAAVAFPGDDIPPLLTPCLAKVLGAFVAFSPHEPKAKPFEFERRELLERDRVGATRHARFVAGFHGVVVRSEGYSGSRAPVVFRGWGARPCAPTR